MQVQKFFCHGKRRRKFSAAKKIDVPVSLPDPRPLPVAMDTADSRT
jgi:hypothetical protein